MTLRLVFFVLVVAVGVGCGPAPHTTVPSQPAGSAEPVKGAVDPLDSPLPLDSAITFKRMDSGLVYYVLPHKKPEKRAQIWLVVDAGSVLEDDDQQGLAHFLEHMGFNGTRRFPKQQLVDFLEKSGVRFGPDLNAYTSFDETVYTLQVPSDDAEVLSQAISVLRDWADGMTLDPEEVEKERGVVLEEWRLGRGARRRLFDKQAEVLYQGSKYARRLPIGKPEVIQQASRDLLLRFYRDWYRPDLMAVVAVGDFDAKAVAGRIEQEFGTLAPSPKPRPRPRVTLPPHSTTLVSIETDPELTSTSVAVVSKLPRRPQASARDYRRVLGEQLFSAMLNARFDEVRRRPGAPFLAAGSSTSRLLRTADGFRQAATVTEDGVERGFAALLEEVLRVERHGFTETELERARATLLRQFQQAVKERDKTDSRAYAAEIVRNFLEGEAMPGREAELALVEKFLPTFTLSELNALSKTLGTPSRVITVAGPTTMPKPSAAGLLQLEKQVASQDIRPFVDDAPTAPLMAAAPEPGRVAESKAIAELGVTEWKLGNGVRVIVKPTTFENDRVRVSAFSPGGHSLVRDADFSSARYAAEVVGQGGIGQLDSVALRKALAGKLVSASSFISELEEGMNGEAAPSDLEALLQLVHLGFVAPRRDPDAFAAWQARLLEGVRNRRLSPETAFFEDLRALSTRDHLRRRPVTPEVVREIDLDKALGIYRDRFADAGDFTFVFVGAIELERLERLVVTYLGSLPTKKRRESWRDVKVSFPPGVQTKTVRQGNEPKARLSLTFHGQERWTRDTDNDMTMLGEVLRYRLRQVLREDLGGVYGVQVGGAISRRPRPLYRFEIAFGCAPDSVEKLKQVVFDEIRKLKQDGVEQDLVDKAKAARRQAHQVELERNTFWLRELERAYRYGDDPRLIPDISPLVEKVSVARAQAAAKRYLNEKSYVLGILLPATQN